MYEDSYSAFLKARNVSERLLRAHSADAGSFAANYHAEKAREELAALAEALGFDLVKREAPPVEAPAVNPAEAA